MSGPTICGAESTVIHTAIHRPIVGALICAALAVGGYAMTGTTDSFGGCGETGGDLYRVTEVVSGQSLVCAVPEATPVPVSKD